MTVADAATARHVLADNVALRAETAADRAFVLGLYATQRADELAMTGWDQATRDGFVDHQFTAQNAHLALHRPELARLIVLVDGGPAGRLYVDRAVDPWRLVELALMPGMTGRGIGASLVAWLAADARATGAAGIDVHVFNDNTRAAAFYRRTGFREAPSDFATHRRMVMPLDRVS